MAAHLLAIDQGTTSSRTVVFNEKLEKIAVAQKEFKQYFPRSGWVEHDPDEIWSSTLTTCRQALQMAGLTGADIAGIGITNQRETTLIWDKRTGKAIHRAIVWQDRRTADYCRQLAGKGLAETIGKKTGLLLDPYFSGTKVKWILDSVEGARKRAEQGELLFGTVDTYLLWHLTGGRVHATDATNASRTMLYNIHENGWDKEILKILDIPEMMLPRVLDCSADFGSTDPELFGAAVRVCGIAGDQQAALIGQACFRPGMVKSTYGTGCFVVLNTGEQPVQSKNRLLTTIAYRLQNKTTYALEGSIFIAGAAVQWLRDGLGLIEKASETDGLALQADLEQQIYLVPAFTGLGAPHWDSEARGALFGLTRGTGPAEICKAVLESVCYQTRDLLEAMTRDWGNMQDCVLRVDGGMVASDYTMQFLSDMLSAPVDRPENLETTVLGAAYLAGLFAGICPPPEEERGFWQCQQRFTPSMQEAERDRRYRGWKDAVRRTLSNSDSA
ncbi:MAG: glycerol kinase [Deltaproteobacteria bacterium]|nr:MAG: glycerol kinase [Deltaproteobacteria bacterium]